MDRLLGSSVRIEVVVLGALLTAVIFLVDLMVPLGIAGGVPYIAPVFLAMWLQDRRLILTVAGVCTLLTLGGLWLSPPGGELSIVITNRILAIAAIWTVAVLALQRKKFEAELAASEATNRAVLATTADGILTLDAAANVLSANPAAERIFGYLSVEVLTRHFSTLLDPEHRELFVLYPSDYLPSGDDEDIATHEITGVQKGGGSVPIEVAFVPVLLEDELRYTVTIRDISDRRLLEQSLLRTTDEERRALGHSLHEELGQSLTGLGLLSRQLARRLESQNNNEARQASELTSCLQEVDRHVLELFRSISPLEASGSFSEALDRLIADTAHRHQATITREDGGLTEPTDGLQATQLYQLFRDLLEPSVADRKLDRLHVQTGHDGMDCWLRMHLHGGTSSAEEWAERVRRLAYRARLIDVRLSVAHEAENQSTVTCKWYCRAPDGRIGRASDRHSVMQGTPAMD